MVIGVVYFSEINFKITLHFRFCKSVSQVKKGENGQVHEN